MTLPSRIDPQPSRGNPLLGARAVLFDLDGTLVTSPLDFARMRREVSRLAAESGLRPEEYAAPDALGMARAAAARLAEPEPFLACVQEALVAVELAALPRAREMPGASELLRALRATGFAVGIVTRNCRAAAERLIERFRLEHRLLLSRDDVPRVKPDPAHLLLAAERLGAPAAGTLVVGDHPLDVQGGRAAGMRTVAFLGPDRPADLFAAQPPDAVVRHLSEIAAWISPS